MDFVLVLLIISVSSLHLSVQAERISALKCQEYQNLKSPSKRSADEFGDFVQVVNGTEAQPNEFPHMAAIGYWKSEEKIYEFLCGGSLISEKFVLTAAHCRKKRRISTAVVRMGAVNKNDRAARDFSISEFIVHEEYNDEWGQNDIALIKLRRRVIFDNPKAIRPICLWETPEITDSPPHITGWGQLGTFEKASDVLMKAKLDILSHDDCSRIHPSIKFSSDLQVCAGVLSGNQDTCHGDSGGPLQIDVLENNRNVTYIVGITSYGPPICGMNKTVAVYTRVSAYLDWIEQKVWAE